MLLEGLQRLEYRGYDSAGLAIVTKGALSVCKQKGRVADLERETKQQSITGTQGIAHTRWATHGAPNEQNAHPHSDCSNSFAVVHNGIIENYAPLKAMLFKEGHTFRSETDSEVIAHLLEKFYTGDMEKAVMRTLGCLEGTFGLALIHKDSPSLIAARRGSPLIVGIGEQEMLVASDAAALLPHTRQVIYLKDDEVAFLNREQYSIKNLKGEVVDPSIEELKWTLQALEKGGYKHFMLKEIFEQPAALSNVLRGRLTRTGITLSVRLDVAKIQRLILTACGTSWHSALIGKHFIESLAGIPTEVDYASEFRYRNPLINESDALVVISQSGETADTLAALREAKAKGAQTVGIVNVVGSSIAREVASGVYLHAGPEIGVASTKAFTSQMTALLLFALHLAQQRKKELPRDLLHELVCAPALVNHILSETGSIKELASSFIHHDHALYLGRGVNFPVALEGALKLKEISYIHAEGYPAAEMKHGPIALIDEHMPVIFVAPQDRYFEKIVSNMQEVKARGGRIIAVTDSEDERLATLASDIIIIPSCSEYLSPLLAAIPLQLLAYYVADMKGLDVDKPRNLAKSVTVE